MHGYCDRVCGIARDMGARFRIDYVHGSYVGVFKVNGRANEAQAGSSKKRALYNLCMRFSELVRGQSSQSHVFDSYANQRAWYENQRATGQNWYSWQQ